MQSQYNQFKPVCPDFEAADCPINCCFFLCLLAKHNRSKKKIEKKQRKLKYSNNSIGNTTASTVQEDDLYGKNNVPTRSSSQTNLNRSTSNDNLPEANDDQTAPTTEVTEEAIRRLNKNTKV
jgi:hypothetical protein